MKIELLYFDGCPSWQKGLENLKSALQLEGANAEILLVQVKSDDEARRLKFLGSPHFRLDGQDLWPEERADYSLSCRIYPSTQGFQGYPTVEMLRKQLEQFKRV